MMTLEVEHAALDYRLAMIPARDMVLSAGLAWIGRLRRDRGISDAMLRACIDHVDECVTKCMGIKMRRQLATLTEEDWAFLRERGHALDDGRLAL
jgi:hypothetical protein